jgi:hypothetical protein
MPVRPPSHRPAWAKPPELQRAENRREHDRDRAATVPWRRWYGLARWRKLRAAQIAAEPLCATCKSAGRITPATVCDHVTPHRGDEFRFWFGPFQSLCGPCHSSAKQREESRHARDRD